MKIERKTEVVLKTTDDKIIEVGDEVTFIASGRINTGVYEGLGKRGALQFRGEGIFTNFKYAVAPSSISAIYKIHEG